MLFFEFCRNESKVTGFLSRRPNTSNTKTSTEDWQQLQSEWRWVHTLIPYLGPPSFILWRIKLPLLFNLSIAICITLDAYYSTFGGIIHKDLSADVLLLWRMTSFILALLLAFRVNKVRCKSKYI